MGKLGLDFFGASYFFWLAFKPLKLIHNTWCCLSAVHKHDFVHFVFALKQNDFDSKNIKKLVTKFSFIHSFVCLLFRWFVDSFVDRFVWLIDHRAISTIYDFTLGQRNSIISQLAWINTLLTLPSRKHDILLARNHLPMSLFTKEGLSYCGCTTIFATWNTCS